MNAPVGTQDTFSSRSTRPRRRSSLAKKVDAASVLAMDAPVGTQHTFSSMSTRPHRQCLNISALCRTCRSFLRDLVVLKTSGHAPSMKKECSSPLHNSTMPRLLFAASNVARKKQYSRIVVAIFLVFFAVPKLALSNGDILSVPPTTQTAADLAARDDRRTSKPFSWDNVDPSKKATCGWNKCFFCHQNGKDGYLVGFGHTENIAKGYERAIMLEERYRLGHYYYREYPPEQIRVPRAMHELVKGLNKKRKKSYLYIVVNVFTDLLNATDTGRMLMAEEETARDDDYTFDVVRVRKAMSPHLEWGAYKRNRRDLCKAQFDKFHAAVLNRTAASERMHAEIRLLSDTMETERWMQWDFQVIIERTGRINHIDLDRDRKDELYDNFQEEVVHLERIADAILKESYDSNDDPCQ